MAQERIFNYEAPDASDQVNRQHLAIIPFGIYRGFDAKAAATSGTTLALEHTTSAFTEVDIDGVLSAAKGVWVSRQGVVIKEDATVNITVTGNAATDPRIDVIVGEHQFVQTAGGATAGYTVITGTAAAVPVAPDLTFPNKQVIIGTLYWPASTSDAANAIYTRAFPGMFGNNLDYLFSSQAQVITGSKAVHQLLDRQYPTLAFNTTTEELSSTDYSNIYHIANVTDTYQRVSTIILPVTPVSVRGVQRISISTQQRLRLNSAAFKWIGDISGTYPEVLIEKGETFEMWYDAFADIYYVARAAELNKSKTSKLFSMLIGNKTNAVYTFANKTIDLGTRLGNVYDVTIDYTINGSVINFEAISHNDNFFNGDNNSKAGAIIALRIKVNGGTGTSKLIDLSSITPPVGFKGIKTNTGTDVEVRNGAVVYLFEDVDAWRLISIDDSQYSLVRIVNDFQALNQAYEHLWQKTQSFSYTSVPASAYNATTNVLTLPNTGNHFEISLPVTANTVTDFITDILLDRGSGVGVTAPDGCIVTVNFKITPNPTGVADRFFINLTGNISGGVTDEYRSTALATKYTPVGNTTIGHTLTFLKTNSVWRIMSTGEQGMQEVLRRVKATEQTTVVASLAVGGAWSVTAGANTPRVTRTGGNLYTLEATITRTGAAFADLICTLPAGYRPSFLAGSTENVFGTLMKVSGITTNPDIYAVKVETDGDVIIQGSSVSGDMTTGDILFLSVRWTNWNP